MGDDLHVHIIYVRIGAIVAARIGENNDRQPFFTRSFPRRKNRKSGGKKYIYVYKMQRNEFRKNK